MNSLLIRLLEESLKLGRVPDRTEDAGPAPDRPADDESLISQPARDAVFAALSLCRDRLDLAVHAHKQQLHTERGMLH